MDDWKRNWIWLVRNEEDLKKFEESEQETQEKLHMAGLHDDEVELLTKNTVEEDWDPLV